MAMAAELMDYNSSATPYNILFDTLSERKCIMIYVPDTTTYYGRKDVALLKDTFEKIGFNVVDIPDPSVLELENRLDAIVTEINGDPSKHDQVAIVFIGHGGCLEIPGTDGRIYKHEYMKLKDGPVQVEDIQRKFYTSSCPGLGGKPKHLYVFSCRGKIVEKASLYREAATREVGERSDFFTFYASSEETVALYNIQEGSCCAQALVAVFSRDYKSVDLVSMAHKVIEELPKFLPDNYVQNPQVVSNIRPLYLDGYNGVRCDASDLPIFERNLQQVPLPTGYRYGSTLREGCPQIYLELASGSTVFGKLIISLNGRCPRRIALFQSLCRGSPSPSGGVGPTWRGTTFSTLWDKGREGEWVSCDNYMATDGTPQYQPPPGSDLERVGDVPAALTAGELRGERDTGHAGFIIVSRSRPGATDWTAYCPVLGHVVAGLEVLHSAINTAPLGEHLFGNSYDFDTVRITDCGLINN